MQFFDSCRASWLESFDLLRHDSLYTLVLVSLKSLTTVYRSLLYAWFLPFTLLIGLVLTIPRLLAAFYITLIIRAARPSITFKDRHYWQQRTVADWVLFFFVVCISYIPRMLIDSPLLTQPELAIYAIYELMLKIFFLADYFWVPGAEQLGVCIPFLSPFLIIWMLFFFDAQNTVWTPFESFVRALMMFLYNYPFFLVTYAAMRVFLMFGHFVAYSVDIPVVSWGAFLLLFGVVVPYWICFTTNFYTKRMHEQFSLYYS